MSKFSMQNFGSSDSLVSEIQSVLEGKRRFRVTAKRGSKAEKALKTGSAQIWARDPMDAIKQFQKEYDVGGASPVDFNVQYEGFEPSGKKYEVKYKKRGNEETKEFDDYESAYKFTEKTKGAEMYSNGKRIHKR